MTTQIPSGSADELATTRKMVPQAAAKLEQFNGSSTLVEGQINLLSLDPIVERLGERWEAKRDAIYDYTERLLEKQLGERGYFLRISEADFLVALPDERRFAAQMRCLRYLRMVLTHFLGEAKPEELTVRAVSSIVGDRLAATLIDPLTVEVDAEHERRRLEIEAKWASVSIDRLSPFMASNGRKVRVSCVLEPVFELKTYVRIGNRIARRVLRVDTETPLSAADIQSLSRSDIERIDLATIARGLDRLRTEGSNQLTLIVPVSFVSLSNRQSRSAVSAMLEEAKAFVKTGVICEVCDVEGVPQTTLLAALSLIKPYCLFLIGRLNGVPDRRCAELRDVGFHALSFEAPEELISDDEFSAWAKSAIANVKLVVKSAMIYRLSSARHAAMAGLFGASHASMKPAGRTEAAKAA